MLHNINWWTERSISQCYTTHNIKFKIQQLLLKNNKFFVLDNCITTYLSLGLVLGLESGSFLSWSWSFQICISLKPKNQPELTRLCEKYCEKFFSKNRPSVLGRSRAGATPGATGWRLRSYLRYRRDHFQGLSSITEKRRKSEVNIASKRSKD